jgi:hypothetical protein
VQLAALGLTATACNVRQPDTAPPTSIRGQYIWGAEVNVFRPCDSDLEYWVVADPETMFSLRDQYVAFDLPPYEAVVAEVRGEFGPVLDCGFCEQYDGSFRMTEILAVESPGSEDCEAAVPADFHDAEYVIDSRPVTLSEGASDARPITRYVGHEVHKDLDGDGLEDVAFVLTHDGGGSGTFYYIVAALRTELGYVGSHGYLLGDRIAPGGAESGPGMSVRFEYLDRAPEAPMAAPPSIQRTVVLVLDRQSMRFVVE